ncbi:MAG TPA: hypothetical protein DCZ03_14960 [Gammaproteobacteria bacterium]|nr:hypothetical protein [Gammaproteobacteria bacterium]
MVERALYIHLPWCARKCPYCDFNSHSFANTFPEEQYVQALCRDLEFEAEHFPDTQISSIFFGGGTPSLFQAQSIGHLLNVIFQRFSIANNIEITLEANPGSSEQQKFLGFKEAGINRLSIGVQSLHDAQLKALGRIHSAREAELAIRAALGCHFDSVNIDLMFALPEQSVEEAATDLEKMLSYDPPHLSYYQLTLEPNTLFYKMPPTLPSEDLSWQMQCQAQDKLRQKGWIQYEVSAYATTNHQCAHNLNYWQYGDYLALGAGAHGKVTQQSNILRYMKAKHPATYMRQAGTPECRQQSHSVARIDRPFEFMLNRLRLLQPFDPEEFCRRTCLPMDVIQSPLKQALEQDMLEYQGRSLSVTPIGRKFLNDLVALFLPHN